MRRDKVEVVSATSRWRRQNGRGDFGVRHDRPLHHGGSPDGSARLFAAAVAGNRNIWLVDWASNPRRGVGDDRRLVDDYIHRRG